MCSKCTQGKKIKFNLTSKENCLWDQTPGGRVPSADPAGGYNPEFIWKQIPDTSIYSFPEFELPICQLFSEQHSAVLRLTSVAKIQHRMI